MKEQFDIGKFLKAGGAIHAPRQEDWTNALDMMPDFGIRVGFNYHSYNHGAQQYPYIVWYTPENCVSATAIHDRETISYEEFICRVWSDTDPTSAASPDEIITMLYEASCV